MKKFFTILFLGLLLGYTGWAQVKIGLPAGAPQSSAVLDLSNSGDGTRGLIIPRVATTNAVLLPAQGMLVYDISSNSMKGYENGTWISYSTQTPAVGVNCTATTLNGLYTQTMALTAANTMIVTVVNNSFSAVTITPSLTDIVLSGTGAPGMSVASFSPATVSPGSGGGTATITYTFSGTPTTVGSFTATWTKLSLTCAKSTNVCLAIAPITVSNTTTPATLPLTTVAGNTVNFTAAGGTPNTGLTWVMSSYPATGIFSNATTGTGAAATAVLVAGASGNVTVTYTATNACGLLVTGTQTANVNPLYVNCATSAINGIYYRNFALNATNNITMQVVNNGNAAVTVTPSTADITFSGTAGISLSGASTSSASIPANGGTATLTYTLSGTPTSLGAFSANWTNQVLACVTNATVLTCPTTSAVTVSNTTSPATLPSTIVAGSTINFTAAGGTPTTGLTWTMTSSNAGAFSNSATGTGATAQAILTAGATGTVTVTYTAANACGVNVTGTQTVNTGDNLRAALVANSCISCAAYDAAAANTWVNITATDYANLDAVLTTNYAGVPEAVMTTTGGWSNETYFRSNLSLGGGTQLVPANNYVIAFSVLSMGNNVTIPGVSLKYSSNQTSGFTTGGPGATIPITTGLTRVFFIMKKPSAVIDVSNPNYVAFYNGTVNTSWQAQGPITGSYLRNWATNDVSNITSNPPDNVNLEPYQAKVTATKKW